MHRTPSLLQTILGATGVVVSFVFVIVALFFCIFHALNLAVVWTALGFHVSYQILFWNKRISASTKGLEITNEAAKTQSEPTS